LKRKRRVEKRKGKMVCGRKTMRWKKAMAIARKQYPHLGLKRRRMVAAAITRKKKK